MYFADRGAYASDTTCIATPLDPSLHMLGSWIAQWLASSASSPMGPGSNPVGAKVMGTDGICKYLPV